MPSEFCPECGMSATCGAEYPFNHPDQSIERMPKPWPSPSEEGSA